MHKKKQSKKGLIGCFCIPVQIVGIHDLFNIKVKMLVDFIRKK